MALLRRYGVQTAVEFPLIKRGAVDFATTSNYTPVGSDTRIHIDAASASYTTKSLQATGSHGWSIALTPTEMSGRSICLVVQDADTKAVEDQMILIETYGASAAQHAFDLGVSSVTLSQAVYDQAVNQIWATASRTLTSLGTGTITADTIADSAASEIAIAVWATASRTLSSFGTLQGDIVNNVWATPSRTLTALGTGVIDAAALADSGASEIAIAVWATGSRTLSSFGTLQGDIVNATWATPSRTLSTAGMNSIADITLRRTAANARASSDGDAANFRSLLGAVSKLVNKVAVNGANLETMQENDTTVFGTQAITTDSAAAPITALDTA